MRSANKSKPWTRTHHRILRAIFGPWFALVVRLRYGVKADRFLEQGKNPWLILYNHQTPCDQFFIMMSFRGPVYHLATEDIFSKGWLSVMLRFLVAPIPIKKQAADPDAIRRIMKVAKEGGTIAIAPEGNRTYSGKTEYMNPAIARLAKMTRLPIALYRIEGGYGVQPRWSDVLRKGKMHAYVSRVIRPEEYEKMTKEELFRQIEEGLSVNEAVADGTYVSEKKAEYLERAVYVCPYCGLSEFESCGNEIECKTCGKKIRYREDKRLEGVGFSFPFSFVNDWYEYQKSFVNQLDVTKYTEEALFSDSADIYEVIVYKNKKILYKKSRVHLFGDRLEIEEDGRTVKTLPFSGITGMAVLGRNKLNVYSEHKVYQFKGSKRFNALKYINIYYRHKNLTRGEIDGEFLGL